MMLPAGDKVIVNKIIIVVSSWLFVLLFVSTFVNSLLIIVGLIVVLCFFTMAQQS